MRLSSFSSFVRLLLLRFWLSPTRAAFSPLHHHYFHHRHFTDKSATRLSATQLKMMHLPSAKALITKAISIGAPAYNEGNIDECAQIYQATAVKVLQSNVLPRFLQTNLEQTLLMANQQSSIDAAWAFRGQFDAILEYQEPITPTSSTRYKDSLKQPFTNQIMFLNDPVVVNDNVMGGRSTCMWEETTKTFQGTTSLANNGGFASLRWRLKKPQNWNHATGIYIRVLSHSKPLEHTFRLLLKDALCEQVRGANYKVTFANPSLPATATTTKMAMTKINDSKDAATIYIPFSAFGPMEQRGRTVMLPSSPSPLLLNTGAVTEIGIMAIKPTVVGDFELTVQDWGLFV